MGQLISISQEGWLVTKRTFVGLTICVLVGGIAMAERNVTFNKDVMPILQRECQSCHRPGQIAPISFMSFEETRPWAQSIREAVVRRTMPPWHADPSHHEFANERRLTEEEINTLVSWVDGGAKRGDPADSPPAREFADAWALGAPDRIYPMEAEYEVPAEGGDEYIYFRVPLDFDEERFVQSLEVMPGNRGVVHHVIVYVQPKTMGTLKEVGKLRLRPILMTTSTTVLGLLPMAVGLGEGSELRAPMAITVIGGLLVATVLTLVIIPAVYSVVDRTA